MAAMTDNVIVMVTPPIEGDWIWSSQYNADVTDCETLLAASTGKCHYIRKIIISCGTNSATISLGSGNAGAGLTLTYIGPIVFSASTSHPFVLDFGEKAMKVAVSTIFAIDGVTAAPVWIMFEYKTV
jgi:hypothetical protein